MYLESSFTVQNSTFDGRRTAISALGLQSNLAAILAVGTRFMPYNRVRTELTFASETNWNVNSTMMKTSAQCASSLCQHVTRKWKIETSLNLRGAAKSRQRYWSKRKLFSIGFSIILEK